MKNMYVYIMSNRNNTTLYVGVTNDLMRRVYEHRNRLIKGFTSQYGLIKLVYFECFDSEEQAILREKYLKKCYRKTKNKLINERNPLWLDLYDKIVSE
ncbi:MAG: GIY-YIG nuclease family protein [Alphaproteobacteria bacterium]|nr:GIY-YIG nuclease family protein [Alphaproteobacteria bacterium]